MKTILFDTDYLIDFLRGKSDARDAIISALSQNTAFISILTVYELYAGMRVGEEEATDNCIGAFSIEYITPTIAKRAGLFRSHCRQRGITLSIVDCIIAETARTHHHCLATFNKKDYPNTVFLK